MPESMRYGGVSYGATGLYGSTPPQTPVKTMGGTVGADGYIKMTKEEYDRLVNSAVRVTGMNKDGSLPSDRGRTLTREVTKVVEVPVVEEVKTAVKGYGVEKGTGRKLVTVKKMVPTTKYKEVDETSVEIKEQVKKGKHMVWRQVEEDYEYTVKVPQTVTKKTQVPYTDYEEKWVEVEVDVPIEQKVEKDGYRIDRVAKGKLMEVKQQELFEMRPHRIGYGDIEVKDLNQPGSTFGVTQVGSEVFPGQVGASATRFVPAVSRGPPSNRMPPGAAGSSHSYGYGGPSYPVGDPRAKTSLSLDSMPKGYSAANDEFITSTERRRRMADLSRGTPAGR